MSRSGYSYDLEPWALIRWRGQVASAVRGRRGQRLLRDLRDALEAMPQKRLIANLLEAEGDVCALGALGRVRGIDMSELDPDDRDSVAEVFDVASPLAAEVVYVNDELGGSQTPEERWRRVHEWVCERIREDDAGTPGP